MTIVPASSLSRAELLLLGHNVLPEVVRDRRGEELAAVNRSLDIHDEQIGELMAPMANAAGG